MKRIIDIEIGDSVWIMHNNVPRKGTIRKIVYMKFRDYFDNDKLKNRLHIMYVYRLRLESLLYHSRRMKCMPQRRI